jgi:hypothetical protein
MSKTVAEWLDQIGAEVKIENTVSKKAASAVVKKKYKKSSFGFDKHGVSIKPERVEAWAKAELNGVEYLVMVYHPKKKDEETSAKTHYQKI